MRAQTLATTCSRPSVVLRQPAGLFGHDQGFEARAQLGRAQIRELGRKGRLLVALSKKAELSAALVEIHVDFGNHKLQCLQGIDAMGVALNRHLQAGDLIGSGQAPSIADELVVLH